MKVFISYRRDDSAGHAGRVNDRLMREFGRDLLFMDVDAIPLGENFIRVLREQVAKCDVLLALIGPHWLTAHEEDGSRRLSNPNDFVRIEIATALHRDIPVIPILLEGAKVPKADQLPEDLKELSARNGLDVRHASFHSDMDRLVQSLRMRGEQMLPPVESGVAAEADLRIGASSHRAPTGAQEATELKGRAGLDTAVQSPSEHDAELNIHGKPKAHPSNEAQTEQKWAIPLWRRPAIIAVAALTAGVCIGGAIIWVVYKGNAETPAVVSVKSPPVSANPASPAVVVQTLTAAPKSAPSPVNTPTPTAPPANNPQTPPTAPAAEPASSPATIPNPVAPPAPIAAVACDTGKVLFDENFSQPNAAWGEQDRNFKVENGAAFITPNKERGYLKLNTGFVFGDADICVTTTPMKSTDLNGSLVGLAFWARDYANLFLFEVSTTGTYNISRMINNNWVHDPLGSRNSDAIMKGLSANKLRLTIQGQILTVGVNGTTLAKLQAQAPGVPTFVGLDSEHGAWKFNSLKVTAVK